MKPRLAATWPGSRNRATPGSTPLALLGGLGVLLGLIGIDVGLGRGTALAGPYLLAPFIPAFLGNRRATLVVAAATVAATILSTTWNANIGDAGYWALVGLVCFGSVLALKAAASVAASAAAGRHLAILDKVVAQASLSASPQVTLDAITELVVPELADVCMIDVLEPGQTAVRAALRASGPRKAEAERTLSARRPSLPDSMLEGGETLPGPRVFERIGPEELRGIAHDAEDLKLLEEVGVSSAITVPLSARGRCSGALTLLSLAPQRRFGEADVRFASLLSDRIAVALDSTGLFTDLRDTERRMETAMAVLEEAVVIHDSSGEPVFANPAAARMLGLERSGDLPCLSLASLRDRFELYDEEGVPLDPADFVTARTLRGAETQVQTLRAVARRGDSDLWVRLRSAPVPGTGDQPLYAVTALEDVSDLKRTEFDQTLLARLGELLASSLDYGKTVERLSEIVVPDLSDWCSVFAVREDGMVEEAATTHTDPAQLHAVREILALYPLHASDAVGPGSVLRGARPINVRAVGPLLRRMARDERHLELLQGLRLGSVMVLPMRSAGRIVGAIAVANGSDRRPFDSHDQRLAERIALRAAGALDNARLAMERSEIAQTLQESLLPAPLADIPRWDVAALFRPAGAENEVGGDFYDAFPFGGGWMVVMGDVTGRGAQAAAIGGQVRHTVRAAATLTGDPLATLATLNRTLLGRAEPALCSLAVIALGGRGSRNAHIAVAGHPPPLLVGPGGVHEAAGTGPVLGAFPDARWDLSSVEVDLAEQIVVFTDGVTEAENGRGRFGEERLRSCLHGVSGPGTSIAVVNDALDEFCSGPLADDAALLALSPHERGSIPIEDLVTFST